MPDDVGKIRSGASKCGVNAPVIRVHAQAQGSRIRPINARLQLISPSSRTIGSIRQGENFYLASASGRRAIRSNRNNVNLPGAQIDNIHFTIVIGYF